ncbi:hypothetical protein MIR68_007501 [Amoeboaphelidium protococcarum]|nr:hypothetical protein MIR68_007501 [Amoeboaphelidium protococcarum]
MAKMLVWMDIEMTGLNIDVDQVLEVCVLVTNEQLKPLPMPNESRDVSDRMDIKYDAEGDYHYFHLVIHYETALMDKLMPLDVDSQGKYTDWCRRTHTQSGLIDAINRSTIDLQSAGWLLERFMQKFFPRQQDAAGDNNSVNHARNTRPLLCGNSIHADRVFLKRFFPRVDEMLHYRMIDVSAVKELCRMWNERVYKQAPKKRNTHRAIDDILESIEELRFYRQHFLLLEE